MRNTTGIEKKHINLSNQTKPQDTKSTHQEPKGKEKQTTNQGCAINNIDRQNINCMQMGTH